MPKLNNVGTVPSEYQVRVTRSGRKIYTDYDREQYGIKLNILDQIIMFSLLVLVWGGVMIGCINQLMSV